VWEGGGRGRLGEGEGEGEAEGEGGWERKREGPTENLVRDSLVHSRISKFTASNPPTK
jgi:hypothetical protein